MALCFRGKNPQGLYALHLSALLTTLNQNIKIPVTARENHARERERWELKIQSLKDQISRLSNLKIKARRDKYLGFELGFIETLRMTMF